MLSGQRGWKIVVIAGVLIAATAGFTGRSRLMASGPAVPGDVTFTKDIAPILQRSCQGCHRPDGVAPMSLVTYADVRPWARAIYYSSRIRHTSSARARAFVSGKSAKAAPRP